MATFEVTAPDISCDNCQRNIEQDLGPEPGVRAVVVNVDATTVWIDYDEGQTDAVRLQGALTDGGYPPAPA